MHGVRDDRFVELDICEYVTRNTKGMYMVMNSRAHSVNEIKPNKGASLAAEF